MNRPHRSCLAFETLNGGLAWGQGVGMHSVLYCFSMFQLVVCRHAKGHKSQTPDQFPTFGQARRPTRSPNPLQ